MNDKLNVNLEQTKTTTVTPEQVANALTRNDEFAMSVLQEYLTLKCMSARHLFLTCDESAGANLIQWFGMPQNSPQLGLLLDVIDSFEKSLGQYSRELVRPATDWADFDKNY